MLQIDEPDTPFAYGKEDGLEEADPAEAAEIIEEDAMAIAASPQRQEKCEAMSQSPPAPMPAPRQNFEASLASQWAMFEGKLEQAAESAEAGELLVGAAKDDATSAKKKAFKVCPNLFTPAHILDFFLR